MLNAFRDKKPIYEHSIKPLIKSIRKIACVYNLIYCSLDTLNEFGAIKAYLLMSFIVSRIDSQHMDDYTVNPERTGTD